MEIFKNLLETILLSVFVLLTLSLGFGAFIWMQSMDYASGLCWAAAIGTVVIMGALYAGSGAILDKKRVIRD